MTVVSVFCCACGRYCGGAMQPVPDIKCDNCKDGAITVDQLKAAVKAAGLERINIRRCGITQQWLYYLVKPTHLLWFDGNQYEARPWDDLAYSINMQKNAEIKQQMVTAMGLDMEISV